MDYVAIDVYTTEGDKPARRSECAIANRIKEQLGATYVDVNGETIAFTLDGMRYKYTAPIEAFEFQLATDELRDPPPFRLILSDLIESHRTGFGIGNAIAPGPRIIRRPVQRTHRTLVPA